MHPRTARAVNVLLKHTDKKTAQFHFWKPIKEEQKLNEFADDMLHNAAEAAYMTLPLITAGGVKMMFGESGSYIDIRPLGLPIAVGGIVLDVVKAPFCIATAALAGTAGGLSKIASLLFERSPSQQAIDLIFKSFLIRMRETATLLIALQLEDASVLEEKLKSGDIEELVGLAALHTAYVSRHHPGLLLPPDHVLYRDNCPAESLDVFDAIMELKDTINKAFKLADNYNPNIREEERNLVESHIACNWMRWIKAGKCLTAEDRPDATEAQLAVVNDIIERIEELKKLGMENLPDSPKSVVKQMPKR